MSTLVEVSAEHACARMSGAQLQALVDVLAELLRESFERRQEAEESAANERTGDDDEEEDDDVPAEEESLLSQIVECVGQGLKGYRTSFLQTLQPKILGYVQMLLPPTRSPSDRTAAICVFDDIIEYALALACCARARLLCHLPLLSACCQFSCLMPRRAHTPRLRGAQPPPGRHCSADGGSSPFVAQGAPVLLRYVTDDSPDVRQAAAYGLGVLAEHAGPAYSDEQCRAACAAIVALARQPTARDEDWETATDNAISALGKALVHRPAAIGGEPSALETWLGYLPVRADKVEASVVHAQLCTLAETHGASLLGAKAERAHSIVGTLVKVVVSHELADAPTRKRAAALLLSMRAIPAAAAALAAAEPTLAPADHARLQAALSA